MLAYQASCVAIGKRALLILGPPGSGKSSLALALIDRGAVLIGDDSVLLEPRYGQLIANPHPNTRGLIEVRNLGIIEMPVREQAPIALAIRLDDDAPRFVEAATTIELVDIAVPLLRIWPGGQVLAFKAEIALKKFGLSLR